MRRKTWMLLLLLLALTGCSEDAVNEPPPEAKPALLPEIREPEAEEDKGDVEIIREMDLESRFNGLNGAAVLYVPSEKTFWIYNRDLAQTRRSPCSTFKIVSSLIALENGIILPDESLRKWSGETLWNADWNQDLDFQQAFRTSCVWYFREVTDEIGKDLMQAQLNALAYGNCDISDWEGRWNTNNHNPALTGFWIESSLKISPKEQTEVMERIFGKDSPYREETAAQLRQAMLVSEEGPAIYGKTGMGKDRGVTADSWFTGFSDTEERRIYFCVYLGESAGQEISSAKAREIAIQILEDMPVLEAMPALAD